MGAYAFEQEAEGQTPAIAFRRAIEKARYDHGNAGYTGTVVERLDSFVSRVAGKRLTYKALIA